MRDLTMTGVNMKNTDVDLSAIEVLRSKAQKADSWEFFVLKDFGEIAATLLDEIVCHLSSKLRSLNMTTSR